MIEVSYVVFWTSFWKLKLIKLHDLQGQYEPWRLLMRRKYQTLLVIKILSEKDYWQTRNLTRFIKTNSQYCRFRQVKHKPTVTSFRTKIWAKFNEVSRKNYVNRQEGGIATATEITHSAEIRRKIILDIGLDLSCRRAQKKSNQRCERNSSWQRNQTDEGYDDVTCRRNTTNISDRAEIALYPSRAQTQDTRGNSIGK